MMIKNNKHIWITALILAALCMGMGASNAADKKAEPQQQTYVQKTIIDVPWGDKPEEFGILNGPEVETIGPRYFAVDRKGNIYIHDIWKNHIKKFDKAGNFEGNIGTNVPTGSSMAIGSNGHIYLLRGHFVDEYLQNGKLIKSHSIANDIPLIPGYGQGIIFDKWGDLLVNNEYDYYVVGRETVGKLEALSHKKQRESKRNGNPSIHKDRRLRTKVKGKHLAILQMLDDNGNIIKETSLSTANRFAGVQVIGQDRYEHIYIETEVFNGLRGHLEIRKYDKEGNLIITLEPKYSVYTLTNKKLELDDEGDIYIYSTTPRGVQVIKWEQQ